MEAFRRESAPNSGRAINGRLWTPEEDDLLLNLVRKLGPRRWESIAKHIKGKTGKSCRTRWVNQLNPEINKEPFTAEEQEKLLRLHQVYGNKWSTLVRFFPRRTDNQLKNLYHTLAGPREMKALGQSSSTGCHDTSNRGSKDLSRCVNELSVGNDTQSSVAPCQGNNFSGFALDSALEVETPLLDKLMSSVGNDTQFSIASCQGNNFSGFALDSALEVEMSLLDMLISSVGNDTHSSIAPCQGNNFSGFALHPALEVETPLQERLISSVYGMDESSRAWESSSFFGSPMDSALEVETSLLDKLISSVGNDTHSSIAPCQVNNFSGFAVHSALEVETPLQERLISSVYGTDEISHAWESSSFFRSPSPVEIYTQQRQNHEGHMLPDANSKAVSELSPAVHPWNGADLEAYQLFDFMGVGTSEIKRN